MQKYGYQHYTMHVPYNNSNLLPFEKVANEYNDKCLNKNNNKEIKKRNFKSHKSLTINNSYNPNKKLKKQKKHKINYISIDKYQSNNTKSLKDNFELLSSLTKEFSNKLNQIIDSSNYNNCVNELKVLLDRLIYLLSNINPKKIFSSHNSFNSFCNETDVDTRTNFSPNISRKVNKDIEELINKYEQKISLLSKENDILTNKLNSCNKYNNNYEELINKIKNLEKENQELKINNKELTNKLIDLNNIINVLKGKISELENSNNKNNFSQNNNSNAYLREEIYQNQINKINDLKLNLDEIISQKKMMDNKNLANYNITKKTNEDLIKAKKMIFTKNTPKFKNNGANTNPTQIKNDIDVLDKEIDQIELKFKQMLQE